MSHPHRNYQNSMTGCLISNRPVFVTACLAQGHTSPQEAMQPGLADQQNGNTC